MTRAYYLYSYDRQVWVWDGVGDLAVGDRVLLRRQNDPSQNGIYVITELNSPYPFVLTRASDFDATGEFTQGMQIPVAEGATYGQKVLTLVNAGPYDLQASSQLLTFSSSDITVPATGPFTDDTGLFGGTRSASHGIGAFYFGP